MTTLLDLEERLLADESGQFLAGLQSRLEEARFDCRTRRNAGLCPDDYHAVTALEAAIEAASRVTQKIHSQLNMRRNPCPDLISLI